METNLTAWRGMERNLEDNQTPLSTLPVVLQYNKRDLPGIAPVQYLEYLLNNGPRRFPSFEASASAGTNVFATLNALAQEILQRFHRAAGPESPARKPENISRASGQSAAMTA